MQLQLLQLSCSSFAQGRRPYGNARLELQGLLQEGGLVSMGPAPVLPPMTRLGMQGSVYNSQLRRRMGQMRRQHTERAAATPTPPVTATITQW